MASAFNKGSATCTVNSEGMKERLYGVTKAVNPNHVVIVGGGLVGAEMAYDMGAEGKEVYLVEALDDICANDPSGVPFWVRDMLNEFLDLKHVKKLMGHRLDSITDKGAVVIAKDGGKMEIEADDVIIAIGFRARYCSSGRRKRYKFRQGSELFYIPRRELLGFL